MPAEIVYEGNSVLALVARKTTPAAALAALGVVYGDLGTSPLYVLRAVVGATAGPFSSAAALGSLSLIFWALNKCVFCRQHKNYEQTFRCRACSLNGRFRGEADVARLSACIT